MDCLGEKLGPLLLQFGYFNKKAFAGVNDATYASRRLSGSITARFYAVVEFTNPVALAIIVGYGAVLANRNEIQVGTVIAFTLLLTRLFEPIEQFIELTSLLQTASAAFSRTFEFLGRSPTLTDEPDAAGLLEYQDLQAVLAHQTGCLFRDQAIEDIEEAAARRRAWIGALRLRVRRPDAGEAMSETWQWA